MGLNIQSIKTSGNWGYLIKRPSGRQGVKTTKSLNVQWQFWCDINRPANI